MFSDSILNSVFKELLVEFGVATMNIYNNLKKLVKYSSLFQPRIYVKALFFDQNNLTED
jgi:hypothetical protein